jgi:hypothetical protein
MWMTFMVELENGKRLEYPTTYDESGNDKDKKDTVYQTPCGETKNFGGCDHQACAEILANAGESHDFSNAWDMVLILGFMVLTGALATSSIGALILGIVLLFSAWYLQGRCIGRGTKVKELQEFFEYQTINGIKARVVPHPEHTH